MVNQGRLLPSRVQPFMLLPRPLQELRPFRSWTWWHLRNNLMLLQSRPLQSRMTQREPEVGRLAPREGSSRLRSSQLKIKRKRSQQRRACSLLG
jgi:hypothetical protein